MLTLFELFGVDFLFIWCGNGVPTPLFLHYTLAHDHFNQLWSNEGKIVPAQVFPHEAEQTLPECVVPLWTPSCS